MGTKFQPFAQLTRSIELFVLGVPISIALALTSVAIQAMVFAPVLQAAVSGIQLVNVIASLAMLFLPVFFHVWFVLVVTGWHLRRSGERKALSAIVLRALVRATPTALVLSLIPLALSVATKTMQVGYTLDDPTGNDVYYLGGLITYSQQAGGFIVFDRQLWSIAWIAVWVAAALTDLPARIMAGPNPDAEPIHRALISRMVALGPWLIVALVLGWPSQTCVGECWGMFEGGFVMLPLFGAYLFTLAASCGAISAASRLQPRVEPPVYIPPMQPFRPFRR